MYSLSKTKSTYKVTKRKKKTKGWIICSENYMDLEKIAQNLTNNVPKICLKRISLSNTTSSSIESDSKGEVLDESTEKICQQDVQPSLSKITLCDTSVESLNNKIADSTGKSLEASNKKSVNERDVELNLSGSTIISDSDKWLNNNAKGNNHNFTKNVILDESLETSIEENNVDQQNNNINFKTSTLLEECLETSNKQVDQQDLVISFPANEILDTSFLNALMENTNYQEDIIFGSPNNRDLGFSFEISAAQSIDQVHNIENKSLEPSKKVNTVRAVNTFTAVNQQEGVHENSEDYNDPDYVVSSNSDDSDNESNASIVSRSFITHEKSNTSKSSLDTSKHTYEGKATCDDTNLIVSKSEKKGANKKYFCMYCKKLQTKFARHLETVHKNEKEVKKFILLPKGNLERKAIIDSIRKENNFIYNTSSQFNTGDLIVSRRPSKANKPATDFTCCPKCKGYFTKNNVRHHFQICNQRSIGKKVLMLGRKVQARIHSKASDVLRKVIFPILREDDVSRVIRYDELVILHANKLCRKFRNQRHHDMIRAELRLLGRFLISIKKFNQSITDFASIYQPRHYDSCILATKDVAQFDPDSNTFKTPSVATRLGTLLKKLGDLLETEYIKRDDNESLRNVQNFLKLLVEDYGTTINKTAEETITQNKRHEKVELPSMEDIQKLYNYLTDTRNILYNDLIKTYNYNTWLNLLKVTLTSLQVFNRKRAGEIEKVVIEDYKCYKSVGEHTDPEVYHSLSKAGKEAIKKYVTFDIRGKLGRNVPVLLHSQLQDCIELLLQHRLDAKVESRNPYLFGIPGYDKHRYKHLRACALMRDYSSKCGAAKPLTLRGTKLRKHIATKCITLNLSESEVTELANFMGHDKSIHKSHYRQSIPELDIPKFSRLLNVAIFNTDENDNDDEEGSVGSSESFHTNDFETNKNIPSSGTSEKKRRSTSPFGSTKRIRWTREQLQLIVTSFHQEIEESRKSGKSRLPSPKDIEKLRKKHPCLQERTVAQIKSQLHNIISGKIKMPKV
ncbi:uncharacterized protein LOC143896600 isoform X2 [Temnothorax americanus]|uniref:uncharacterized protein LOC143896600 isoform X2 n=1 Tax=Temnothorax americanus TaxID=1964332 RepID=UPI004068617D